MTPAEFGLPCLHWPPVLALEMSSPVPWPWRMAISEVVLFLNLDFSEVVFLVHLAL